MGKTYNVISDWFKKTDALGHEISSWCKKEDEDKVYCNICSKIIHCSTKGFAALTQHVATSLHNENASVKLHSNQLLLKGTNENSSVVKDVPQLTMVCNREAVMKAEIFWALKSVQCNMAASASNDLKDLFKIMFPCSEAEHFHLGRTKLTYLITEALGPFFRRKLINDIGNSYFTLLFDETTNNAEKKELQFQIRFWSKDSQEITCRHLQTVFIGHATANDIARELEAAFETANLSFDKLLMLGSDGPNVNKAVWNIINKKVFDIRSTGLLDIGTCNLHIIHNAYLKGLEEFGDTATELVIDLYYYFKKFPSRWEDFEKIQIKKNLKPQRFIKHSTSRWLTIGPACERVLEQWPAIIYYFTIYLPENDKKVLLTEKYTRILKILKCKYILVEITFIAENSQMFSTFSEFFQHESPLIHVLASELNNLLIKISGRICKPGVNLEKKIEIDQLNEAILVDCGNRTKKEITKLKDSDQKVVRFKIQRHYMASYNHIISKNILKKGIISDLRCLGEDNILHFSSVEQIGRIANSLSFIGIKEIDVKDEWRILQSEMMSSKLNTEKTDSKRIDHFWRNFIYQKTSLGTLKYPSLKKLVTACLTLSHGNSDVERGFSISKRILAEDKALMSERVLNDRLTIRDALKSYPSIAQFKIDKELMNLAYHARKSYEMYLDEQRKIKEEKLKIQKEKEEKLEKEKLHKEKISNLKESVKKLEKKALLVNQEKNEIQESADKLSEEANERLKAALKTKDLAGIRIAQGMIEGSLKLRQKQKEHEDNEKKLNRIVNKRKQSLIESFMSKKQKK